jgi:hypothetical protein
MKQRLLERRKPRRRDQVFEALPIDPRDPDVVRVKQRRYAEGRNAARRAGRA